MMPRTKDKPIRYLFVYGSLMKGEERHDLLTARRWLEHLGSDEGFAVPGQLYDIGQYPGLRDRNAHLLRVTSRTIRERPNEFVRGELYRILDEKVLDELDAYERYDKSDPDGSLYIRKVKPVFEIGSGRRYQAYVYVYNEEPVGYSQIMTGFWADRVARVGNG